MEGITEDLVKISLSEVLNSLDGMFSSHGRILITTTNHIEALDPALIRPGRIDLKLEIGYVTTEVANSFLRRFFPGHTVSGVREGLTTAELQGMLLKGMQADKIIEEIEK